MNTSEHPQAPTRPSLLERQNARAATVHGEPGTVLLSFGPLGIFWPIASVLLVAVILALAAPGLALVAAVLAVFGAPYLVMRRVLRDR